MSRTPKRVDRIVAIDLDGTLLPGTSVSEFLALRLGHAAMLAPLEGAYRAGLTSNAPIADGQAALLGGLAIADIEGLLAEIPTLDGIASTVARLKAAGAKLLLATVTWSFGARYFAGRFGFDAYCGSVIEERDRRLVGRVARHFNAEDKRAFVAEHCALHGLGLDRAVAVGDSRSDLPLFEAAGLAIALNGTAEAVAAADIDLSADSLEAILPHLR